LTQLTDNLMQNKLEETKVYETTAELDVFEEKTVECAVSEEQRVPSPVDYVFEEEWSSRQSGGAREAREGARW
jgi:hypothetical protein